MSIKLEIQTDTAAELLQSLRDLSGVGYAPPAETPPPVDTTPPPVDTTPPPVDVTPPPVEPPPVEPPPVSTPPSDQVVGAVINDVVQATAPLTALIGQTPANSTLLLPVGAILGTSTVDKPCTISGRGMGQTVLDCSGLRPTWDKAVLVPIVPGVTIKNMTIKGASVASSLGANAAGVREGNEGAPFTLDSVEITGCQNGLLTFGDNITIRNGSTHDNGSGNASTHELYIGGSVGNVFTLENWTSRCGSLSTHALKSRASKTVATGCTFRGSADSSGNIGGSVINIPDGGVCDISNSRITIAAGAANIVFANYAMESNNQAAAVTSGTPHMSLRNCVFEDQTGSGGLIICDAGKCGNAVLDITGSTYTADQPPQVQGFAQVIGTFAKAA